MTMWLHLPTIFSRRNALLLAGLLGLCVAITTTLIFTAAASATTDLHTLAFQGRLLMSDGDSVPDGHYNIQFKIYDGGSGTTAGNTGGTLKWNETYINNSGSSGVNVKNSFFSVNLGSNTPFGAIDWSSTHLWLSINVAGSSASCTTFGSGGCAADGEMLPMTQITASPYAMDSGKLNGKTADNFVQLSQGTQTDSAAGTSLSLDKTAAGNFIELTNSGVDAFTLDGSGNIGFGGSSAHSISLATSDVGVNGHGLNLSAGGGGSGSGSSGGTLTLKGGAAGGTNANGGNLVLTGGSGTGSGTDGLVVITTPTFRTISDDPNCFAGSSPVARDCTFAAASINNAAVITAGFTAISHTATVPSPTNQTAGRMIYITASSGSQDFALSASGNSYAMHANTTISLLWSGSAWTSIIDGTDSGSSSGSGHPAMQVVGGDTTPMSMSSDGTLDNSSTLTNVTQSDGTPSDTPELGSIYYDTVLASLQCYEKDGWGPCAASPDEFVTLSPQYAGAVVHGDGSGNLTTDMCSGSLHINDGTDTQPSVCGEHDTYNYYNWTSSETSDQSRSIFVTYNLPSNFKKFVPKSTSLLGLADGTDGKIDYQIYRSHPASGLTACGSSMTVANSDNSGWQTKVAKGTNDPANCDFEAGDNIVVRINLHAANDANVYASTLNFAFSSQ